MLVTRADEIPLYLASELDPVRLSAWMRVRRLQDQRQGMDGNYGVNAL